MCSPPNASIWRHFAKRYWSDPNRFDSEETKP
jgi:hypothetical protein